MKKLLGIVVLGLLLSGNANAEKIILSCKGEFLGTKYDDHYIIDTEKKTLRISNGEDVKVEISDSEILMTNLKTKKSSNGYNIRLMRFDRYSGHLVSFNVYLNDNEYQSLQSQIELSSTKEMKSNWIEIAATKAYANKSNKDNIFYGALCKKSDKKF